MGRKTSEGKRLMVRQTGDGVASRTWGRWPWASGAADRSPAPGKSGSQVERGPWELGEGGSPRDVNAALLPLPFGVWRSFMLSCHLFHLPTLPLDYLAYAHSFNYFIKAHNISNIHSVLRARLYIRGTPNPLREAEHSSLRRCPCPNSPIPSLLSWGKKSHSTDTSIVACKTPHTSDPHNRGVNH